MSQEIRVAKNADELAVLAANVIVQAAAKAVAERGRFTLVLAGGRTPEKAYSLLVAAERNAQPTWENTYFFFGDERFVPHDDPRSNFYMAQNALLAKAPIDADHVLAIPTDVASPTAGAAAYAVEIARFFQVLPTAAPPAFDLILLGLGDDGHTASLFPGAAALAEQRAWVTSSPPGILPPPVDRVTLTFPVLNAARQVVFLVSGANKAAPVRDVLGGHAKVAERPAAGLQPKHGTLTWLLDDAAAELLPRP